MSRPLPPSSASVVLALLASAPLAHDGLDKVAPFPNPRHSGQGIVAFPSNGVQLLGWIPVPDFDPTFTSANDCWGYTAPGGSEYAIIGLSAGTAFVDISDPGAPDIVAVLSGPDSLWHDVKTYQDHAYVVSEGGSGIQVFDLSLIDSGVVTHVGDVTTGGCTDASHNVAIDTVSGFLYRCGGSFTPCGGGPQGLVFYDLANPANPVPVGEWHDRYVHDAQVVTWDIPGPHFGKEIAFCAAETGAGGGSPSLHIVDVSDKGNPFTMGSTTYTNSGFSHQLWLSDDRTLVYQNDEFDESNFGITTRTRIMDVTDLTSPSVFGFFTSGSSSIDHNLYVKGNRIYEANYRSGLRVFDNTNPLSPTQIAWFDTWPEDDQPEYNSLWSNYPFFDSGTVIGSDMEKGLFVFHVGAPVLTFAFPDGIPELVDASGATLRFTVDEQAMGDLLGGSVRFHYDAGAGFQEVVPTALGGNLYQADLPGVPCGETVSFYASARATNGVTWTDPPAGPTQVHVAVAAVHVEEVFMDDMEVDLGWTVGAPGDDATTGIWERVNPRGTSAQPEDDHTPAPGTQCWVTGQGPAGGGTGDNDVDGGTTTLISPSMDASGLDDPILGYWRWFSNSQGSNPGEDVLVIDISNDAGGSWVPLEVVGPTGIDTLGGWIEHRVRIADFVAPTNQIRLRLRASDLGAGGSIVEAAIDDITIEELVCTVGITSVNPASGPTNGRTVVTITGEGFVAGVTTVSFGESPSADVTVLGSNQLSAVVPPRTGPSGGGRLGRAPRAVDVRVTTGGGTAVLPRAFTYTLPLK